ncbi:lipase family protein [Mycobacteroides chelonae]|uniref:lipase family protein n=1 Tax=Mycobacteroides chelonae TaxID=1774 RepID=UPI0007A0F4C4|nr:lipase family protein [Mycobacteroides chelonae]AMW20179.1 triacylglycerol lipase [Mycobacterium sp. QIA-37]MBV0916603.1 lipase family protein [Mycobacteroides chelonae]
MAPHDLAISGDVKWIGEPPHQELERGARPLLPTEDPFYLPPRGFEHALPGTVLRTRDVEIGFLGVIPQRFTATQLLYRSNDLNRRPEAAVTTVLTPTGTDPAASVPIVSYQCAIDAVTDRCFPSYALRRGAHALGSFTQLELLLIAALLAQGWAVSIPDHEGVDGTWGAPEEPGYRALDGIRAALDCERLGLSRRAPIGLWGYSGGGLATAWAAEVSAEYAPELDIAGAVLGSPVGDLGHTFRRLNGGLFAALPGLVVAALSHVYPGLERVIEEHATPQGKEFLGRLEGMPTLRAIVAMAFKDMDDLVDQPLDQLLETPEVQHVFESIKLGKTVPTPPVLIVQAVHDQIISTSCIDELAETYRGGGAHVAYHRDLLNEHLLLHPMSAPMSMAWLRARFAGDGLGTEPRRTSWPLALKPSTYLGLFKLGWVSAKVLGGRPL